LDCTIVVADSSDAADAERNNEACRRVSAKQWSYAPDIPFYDKLVDALVRITTPLVVMLPDDDIALPHSLERCAAFLAEHDDFAAAWGYALDYATNAGQFDILGVRWFVPSLSESSPFERIYHLVRRYQPFFWAVFRTPVLIESIKQARAMKRIAYQEMTVMLTSALQGKVARLPVIYSLRGQEPSSYNRASVMPLYAFLEDASGFLREYVEYRDRLIAFARRHLGESAEKTLHDCTIEHFFDLVHGIGLVREIDPGSLSYIVQKALGAPYPPIPLQRTNYVWKEPSGADLVRQSSVAGRQYVWRGEVLNAEPKSEIVISCDEIAIAEKQMDQYAI